MFLTEIKKHAVPSLTPFIKKHYSVVVLPNKLDLITRAFDDALLRRLKTLSPPSITLSWLSTAVDFLAVAHSEARSLISDLEATALEYDDALATYLDDSVKLLHICNAVSAEIERLRRRRTILAFAAQLLADGKARRAREVLTECDAASGFGKAKNAEVLVRDLALGLDA